MEDEFPPDAERETKLKESARWGVYEKTLQAVKATASSNEMRVLASWIKNKIRETGELPSGEAVRREGGRICMDEGYEVEPGSWLRPR